MSLNIPRVESITFNKNLIRTAICQLRFNEYLKISQTEPVRFQEQIRHFFPVYRPNIEFEPVSGSVPKKTHEFCTEDGAWKVVLTSTFLALETNSYLNFSDFMDRLRRVLIPALEEIDSEIFTRVGLRYVNSMGLNVDDSLDGWVKEELIAPLNCNELGATNIFRSQINGSLETGSYNFNYGVESNKTENRKDFTLDFDYYHNNVRPEELEMLLAKFNETNFSFFWWALGPKAKEWLQNS